MDKNIWGKTQEELQQMIRDEKIAEEIDGNFFIQGELPLLLVAHMDTVYDDELAQPVLEGDRLYSKIDSGAGIGGDDRCGCWVLMTIYNKYFESKIPSLLFVRDEEFGGKGSLGLKNKIDMSQFKAVIEIDGPGYGIFYSDSKSNSTLDSWLKDRIGLWRTPTYYNDIQNLCGPGLPPGITLGAAYYNQHMRNSEWVSKLGLETVLKTVEIIMAELNTLEWSVLPKTTTLYYPTTYLSETYPYKQTNPATTTNKQLEIVNQPKKVEDEEKGEETSVGGWLSQNCYDCEFDLVCGFECYKELIETGQMTRAEVLRQISLEEEETLEEKEKQLEVQMREVLLDFCDSVNWNCKECNTCFWDSYNLSHNKYEEEDLTFCDVCQYKEACIDPEIDCLYASERSY
jgi:hypothetical protein